MMLVLYRHWFILVSSHRAELMCFVQGVGCEFYVVLYKGCIFYLRGTCCFVEWPALYAAGRMPSVSVCFWVLLAKIRFAILFNAGSKLMGWFLCVNVVSLPVLCSMMTSAYCSSSTSVWSWRWCYRQSCDCFSGHRNSSNNPELFITFLCVGDNITTHRKETSMSIRKQQFAAFGRVSNLDLMRNFKQ